MTIPTTVMPDNSLKSMAEMIGKLPPGDIPAAWYLSVHPDVISAYRRWQRAHKGWRDRVTELCEKSGLKVDQIKIRHFGGDALVGIDADVKTPPEGWRRTKDGYLVPRKRTKAEKNSEVSQRFNAVRNIPSVLTYLPGLPTALFMPGPGMATTAYAPQVRMPSKAVLVFLAGDPDQASEPFTVGPQWSRMKMSIFHLLRERQASTA